VLPAQPARCAVSSALGAERATGKITDHMDIVRLDPEALGDPVLEPINERAWSWIVSLSPDHAQSL